MTLSSVLNNLSRIYNKYVMTLISLAILILLASSRFHPEDLSDNNESLIMLLWVIFIVISILYSLNGILLNRGFQKELYKFQKAGKPLKGVRGFSELMEGLASTRLTSLIISFASLASFVIFYLSLRVLDPDTIETSLIATIAVTMAFVSISVVFIVKYPEGTAIDPGALCSYYEPDSFPMLLDNILSDVFLTHLDPITFMTMDDWTNYLESVLHDSFEPGLDQSTRLERARERIFLLAYLANSIPETVTDEVLDSELSEIVGIDNIDRFRNGENAGLSWNEIRKIITIVEKETPDVFRLVDRLLINLMDNYSEFTNKDLYFTISTQTNQGSISESSGAIVFFLNNTNRAERKMKIEFRSDFETIHPNYQKIEITLDPYDQEFPDKRPDFISEGFDILSLLSTILQVGDAVWLRFKPKGFGFKVVTIQAEEVGTSNVFGESIEMKFTKSIGWYVKTFAPKLSALGGVALPVIQSLFFV